MALITNNISGSSADSWRIGITGSVRIGNPGANPFPSMPGSDVDFFVSGSIGGKGTSGVSVFGGDAVISGSLTVGTGSITITSNEIIFQGGNAKISSGSGGLTFFDSDNSGGITLSTLTAGAGGGDVDGPASSTDNAIARFDGTTGKIIQNTSGVTIDDSNNVVTSGSFITKDGSGVQAVSLSNGGVVSGSSDFQVGGNITIAGNIDTDQAEAKTLFASAGANNITIGGSNSTVIAAGTLQVNGNISSDANEAKTIFSEVTSNTITIGSAGSTVAADTLSVGGGFGSSGVTISSTGNISADGNLTVKGDLYISGTVTTIDSTITEIQDPVIGLGFSSGSIALSAGDRGFIGGITGAGNNVAFIWSNSNTSFVATKTTSSPTGSVATAVDITSLQPVRAARFDVGGTTAFVTSSNGTTLTLDGNIIEFDPNTGGAVDFKIATTPYLQFKDGGAGNPAQFGAVGGKSLVLSGSTVNLNAGTSGFNLQLNSIPIGFISGTSGAGSGLKITAGNTTVASELVLSGTTVTLGAQGGTTIIAGGTVIGNQPTQNIFNTNATTVNFAGAGTDINVGSSGAGSLFLKNSATRVSGTLVVAGLIEANNGTIATNQTTFNLVNATATTVNFAGAGTNINIGANGSGALYLKNATTNISGSTLIAGNSTLGSDSTDKIYFSGSAASSLIPDTNNAYDLGGPNNRWRNMYTGDLHLRNERGDWTIIEEREFLTITNNHSGRRYKFMLEEI